ncbi:MAG: hypothetical protein O2955_17220 [Planctomycetota bacterium]|nr:hypothetical protein [Planctomycetota bacterium]MDA1214252.1 hypothetical protein [Planctomycetota bacterium]
MTALGLLVIPGCLIVQTTVTNPNPAIKTIAVIPFFNLSQEPTVDGRRFALAYFSELQKTPGFQVIPLGVTEQAIREFDLEMNNPADVLQLAEYLNVDAVVVGAVTDFDQYYPPRIGMQVSWYSPYGWEFSPGFPVHPQERKEYLHSDREARKTVHEDSDPTENCPPDISVRGQSIDNNPPIEMTVPPAILEPPEIVPLMSYTRIFDGTDSKLVAALRDYVELSGDKRSGGWEAYLHRSEDFIRFSCHRMIVEMLTLHGGEAQRRYVWKLRKER